MVYYNGSWGGAAGIAQQAYQEYDPQFPGFTPANPPPGYVWNGTKFVKASGSFDTGFTDQPAQPDEPSMANEGKTSQDPWDTGTGTVLPPSSASAPAAAPNIQAPSTPAPAPAASATTASTGAKPAPAATQEPFDPIPNAPVGWGTAGIQPLTGGGGHPGSGGHGISHDASGAKLPGPAPSRQGSDEVLQAMRKIYGDNVYWSADGRATDDPRTIYNGNKRSRQRTEVSALMAAGYDKETAQRLVAANSFGLGAFTRTDTGGGSNGAGGGANGGSNGGGGGLPSIPGGGNGVDPELDRIRSIYQMRSGESLQDWSHRVFGQATQEFGPSYLNPNSATNPFADSPYARWFSQNYQNTVPVNIMLQQLLGGVGSGPTDEAPLNMYAAMGGAFNDGAGGLGRLGLNSASQNLQQLQGLLNQYVGGNTAGLDPTQIDQLQRLASDPSRAASFVMAQLNNTLGGYGGGALNGIVQDMVTNQYDNVVDNNPATAGSFLSALLRKFNLG